MRILKKTVTFAPLLLLLLSLGCATPPEQKSQTLPQGHPPVKGKKALPFRDPQGEAYASYIYGLMLADEGRSEEAIGFLQMAARLDSRSPEIVDQMMRIYMGEGRQAEAQQAAEKILQLDSQWSDAHLVLGQIYLETDRPLEAANHLEIAHELDPGPTNTIFLLADALERTGEADRAIAFLQELTESEDHQAIAHFYIARLQLRAGNPDASLESLVKAVELNTTFFKGRGRAWSPA